MISADEFLERVVAGIHAVTAQGADVTWNEKINGRQFDVVVRFRLGTMTFFVVVEVKNKGRRLPVHDMESFVTKCRDHNVNKAVFVTVAGYQQGAIDVAQKYGIDLYTVAFEDDLHIPRNASFVAIPSRPVTRPPTVIIGEPAMVASLTDLRLVYADGTARDMPSERSQLAYYLQMTKLDDGRSLQDVFNERPGEDVELGRTQSCRLSIVPARRMTPPDEYAFQAGDLIAIDYKVTGRMGRGLSGNAGIDPGLLVTSVAYANVLTGEAIKLGIDELPLGVKRVEAGRFYFIPNPLLYYYCADITGETVTWLLIESFQQGKLIRCTLRQNISGSPHYIPVTDKKIIARLRRRLDEYIRLSEE